MSGWDRRGPRVAFTTVERRRILKRDRWICHVCQQPGADQADHVVPVSEGGAHSLSNGAAIHGSPCHTEKSRLEAERGYQRRLQRLRLPAEPHPFYQEVLDGRSHEAE